MKFRAFFISWSSGRRSFSTCSVDGDLEFHNFVSEDVFSVSNARQDLFEIGQNLKKYLKI